MAPQERRALQRTDNVDRALGPRGVPEWRRLADRVALRQRSEVPHRRLHDEHALQERTGRVEVEADSVPSDLSGEGEYDTHSSIHALGAGTVDGQDFSL